MANPAITMMEEAITVMAMVAPTSLLAVARAVPLNTMVDLWLRGLRLGGSLVEGSETWWIFGDGV